MKAKEMNEIIGLCEPLSIQIFENDKMDENSLKSFTKDLKKIKPILENFVNTNQGISQKTYFTLNSKQQEFCDDIEGLHDSIDDIEDLIKEDGDDVYSDIMNFEDVRDWFFRIMDYKKEKTKAVTISLTELEEKYLIQISENFFGQSNKSGMVRYWINKAKDEART